MKKYYKVVRESGKKLYSAVMERDWNGVLCREYKEGKWTFAPKLAMKRGYGLTCFDNVFIAMNGPVTGTVWECIIGEEIALKTMNELAGVNGKNVGLYEADNYGWPTGTVMTDKIKLIRRVK
jgi:hypothetical protein